MGATVVFLDKGAKVTECGANLGSFLSQFEEELNMILGGFTFSLIPVLYIHKHIWKVDS